ncbi:MAG: PaeR7I family type II restriction endonuclease [Kiritimatiellia bacterium]
MGKARNEIPVFRIWVAYREKAFGVSPAPWLGYLFFLEDSEAANRPVGLARSPLPPLKVFEGASYRRRYEILCERLVLERDYSAAALVVSGKDGSVEDGGNSAVSAFSFFKSLFLHLSACS